ncbi:MAG: LPS assembly lipoprotein LptE [Gammaproteobacteria bacterium]|nr:LPS assembly lipoprotein LptE [Gammaproteobacteria bacterium]
MAHPNVFPVVAVLVLATMLLDGCGFRPRGTLNLPEDVRNVYIQAPGAVADEIQIFLDGEKVNIMPGPADADVTIAVTSERYDKRVTAVDPSTGKEREFEIVYTVYYNVIRDNGAIIVPPKELKFRRDYVFDPATVLGDTNEEQVLREEMRSDAAYAIVRGLEAALAR